MRRWSLRFSIFCSLPALSTIHCDIFYLQWWSKKAVIMTCRSEGWLSTWRNWNIVAIFHNWWTIIYWYLLSLVGFIQVRTFRNLCYWPVFWREHKSVCQNFILVLYWIVKSGVNRRLTLIRVSSLKSFS